jgi:peptide/nickel transport system permease protein
MTRLPQDTLRPRWARLVSRLGQRLAWGVVTLLGTAAIVFGLVHIGGDPAVVYAGEKADQATVERIRHEMGFDRPLPVQFVRYLGRVLHGDLGRSTFYDEPVSEMLLRRLPATTELALGGLLVWVGLGVPMGILTATRRGTWVDHTAMAVAVIVYSLPVFWLGRMLQHQFAYVHPWFPVGSIGSPAHLVLPAMTLGLAGVGYYMRLVHTNMIEVLPADYVRTARAKGLSERTVLWHHAFRNAMLPVVTVLGLDTARLLGGVVFTEAVFAWPGIGSQAVQAIFNVDLPVVMGTVLFSATLVVLANIAVDLVYQVLDPRLRDEEAAT